MFAVSRASLNSNMIDKQLQPTIETAILVGVITQKQTEDKAIEYLDELEFLAHTAGAVTKKRFLQKLEYPHPRTYVGAGKVEEIAEYIRVSGVNVVIFDDELSPSQLRNLENILDCKVLDRTNLILDIFAARAQTAHAKTQVELAQYQYLLPRLTRMWTHLSRQKGGIGMRGPGETEIETDRRIIREKIAKLKLDLIKIDKQMGTQRKNRAELIRVSLVGYTNVGKSTIMNLLSKSDVFAENKLFATLDTTVRKVVIDNLPFLLSDTVGFIRKLPHGLVESFKSTLDEVRESDLLLHIIDVSHPNFEEQVQVVNATIQEIGAGDKPMFMVFNKIDAFSHVEKDEDDLSPLTRQNVTLQELEQMWFAKSKGVIFISAKQKENVAAFRTLIYGKVKELHQVRYPYNNFLYETYEQ